MGEVVWDRNGQMNVEVMVGDRSLIRTIVCGRACLYARSMCRMVMLGVYMGCRVHVDPYRSEMEEGSARY